MTVFICTKCKQEKLVELFPKKGKQCKSCVSQRDSAYVEQNRARVQARKNAWQQTKRAEIKTHSPVLPTPLQVAKTQGAKQYFTGKPCAVGHIANRLTASRACVICTKIKLATYRENNRDTLLEKKRAHAKKICHSKLRTCSCYCQKSLQQ